MIFCIPVTVNNTNARYKEASLELAPKTGNGLLGYLTLSGNLFHFTGAASAKLCQPVAFLWDKLRKLIVYLHE